MNNFIKFLIAKKNELSLIIFQSDNQDTTTEDKSPLEDDVNRVDGEALVRAIEERRRSCLDHHWAVPKHSVDSEKEDKEEKEIFQEPEQGKYLFF